jgi:hypothetical protein
VADRRGHFGGARRAARPTPVSTRLRRSLNAATRLNSRPLDRRDAWLLAAMALGSLALYVATAARTVTG